MSKILMILTSHRLDCFRLCIDMLVRGGSAERFERIVILCSGVQGGHLRYVRSLPHRYPRVRWDFIEGPRGWGKPISDMQNACVKRYPGALYFKLDEDTFVSRDWDLELGKVYEQYRGDPNLALMTAVVTNNQRGAYHLLTTFPELGEAFTRLFNKPIVTERMGPVWILPQCAAFMIRNFLDLEAGNRRLREANRRAMASGIRDTGYEIRDPGFAIRNSGNAMRDTRMSDSEPRIPPPASRIPDRVTAIPFSYPFSINCICYDYRHWQEIGGVPEEDENGWGAWIPENGKIIVLAADALVHHYSFFVQQNWLDRTSILEEIRKANVPETCRPMAGFVARLGRIARQMPGAARRRLRSG